MDSILPPTDAVVFRISLGRGMEHPWRVDGPLGGPLGDAATVDCLREQNGSLHGTFRERSGNSQGTFRDYSGSIQGTFRDHSGNNSGNIWKHSGNNKTEM